MKCPTDSFPCRLRRYAGKVFLVRSKADELEKYTPAGTEKVLKQWRDQFGVSHVYLTKVRCGPAPRS
jgi:hypothetical protein